MARGPYWSFEEDARLREVASRGSMVDAMRELGRSRLSLKRRAGRLRIRFALRGLGGKHKGRTVRAWTPAEDAELAMLVGERSQEKIGRKLGRSRQAINSRICQLHLRTDGRRLTLAEAAKLLGVSHSTVQAYRNRLGKNWRSGNGASPGLDTDDVMELAAAILATPTSQVTASASHLRRIAEGGLLA